MRVLEERVIFTAGNARHQGTHTHSNGHKSAPNASWGGSREQRVFLLGVDLGMEIEVDERERMGRAPFACTVVKTAIKSN